MPMLMFKIAQKKEQISFGGGKHIDLKINKSINANIKLRKLQFKI
ncbi:hypothetical protein J564_2832 [Acinetobacter baumannii 1525283]|nr:hypothetical protein CSB70_2252 [Acinetobacter baumannii]EKP41483.1 hypothetical protein ACIN5099_2461 [Acinetobacter baumannii OIFC099]ETR00294.1 hypothetical protein P673_2183 [Acinetobacter baumannii UH6507]EXD53404.1 hypothetical protein J498_2009 [Acinetobacter baumannii 781407]EXE29040.1 hypothetical protein J564_2832 [Acinetobacter baumannii 1525283]